ncbi:MAG TPA: ABC transporter substrate-binding protein, partial [Chloroflexota bacterium]|nr:ABC transporter substrate-binding protein [Chloroflexota bacterium]
MSFPKSGILVSALAVVLLAVAVQGRGLVSSRSSATPLDIGAIYPISTGGAPAKQEYQGLETAVRLVDSTGGVHGRRVRLILRNVRSGVDAPQAVTALRRRGVRIVAGSEQSMVGIPASEAAQAAGLIYWEDGAVATMLTARGESDVFRTVTTGQSLGRAGADFAASVIAPRLRIPVRRLRVADVHVIDAYGSSVGAAQIAGAKAHGMQVVKVLAYHPGQVNWVRLVSRLKAARPNVVLVSSYLGDAVKFRRETIR